MHANGEPNHCIAKALGLNRNSITAHLSGEIAYPAPVYRSIKIVAPLRPSRWLTIPQAAVWIPGRPSRSKMETLIAGRSWRGRAIPRLSTRIVGRRRMTTIASIRRFVATVYPAGIWLTEDTLMNFVPYSTLEFIPLERLGWHRATSTHFGNPIYAVPLVVAARVARSTGDELSVPAEIIHRATTIERHIGTAVI